MKLQVGLTSFHLAWLQVIEQEKIPYHCYPVSVPYNVGITPVLIVTSASTSPKSLMKFVKEGGALVTDKKGPRFFSEAFWIDHVIKVDLDLEDYCMDWDSTEKEFHFDNVFVTEKVARQKKSVAREKVVHAIKSAFWRLNLPYVHLWYYPYPYENVFSFRFDLDDYEANDFQNMYQLLKKYQNFVSCFVCLKSYERLISPLNSLAALGIEIASHAYVHHVYNSYKQNFHNVTRAERLLEAYSEICVGFAGPHGKWHPTLERVLEKKGYLYSSEFGLDYDNYPFFPLYDGKLSRVLHIPTHGICDGVFLERYPFDEGMIDRYYQRVISYLAQNNLPILIFGHPSGRIGRYPKIFENIVRCVSGQKGVWQTTFREFAFWWIRRGQQKINCDYDEDGMLRLVNHLNQIYALEIAEPSGHSRIILAQELAHGISLRVIDSLITSADKVHPIHELRKKHSTYKKIKLWIKDVVDWETKTPLSEMKCSDWQTALKYVLRLIYDSFRLRNGRQTFSA